MSTTNRKSELRRRLSPGDRKKEILGAAARAFSEMSYDDVHVDAIARDAGASRALVNHYFRDKRGLFLAVIQQRVERLPRIVRADLDLPAEKMVAANTAAWLDLVEADRPAFMLFARGGPLGSDPEFEQLVDQLRDRLVDRVLANHFGSDVPATARFTMRATLAMMERAVRDWVTGAGGSREQVEALVSQAILVTVRTIIPAVEAAGGGTPGKPAPPAP
jgi:AcrR family transcriptional regulator